MNKAEATVSIQYIARHLQVRPKRVQEKAHKLSLSVPNGILSVPDAIALVQTYVQNNKVSGGTKERATLLLKVLKNGSISVPSENEIKPQKKGRKTSGNISRPPVRQADNQFSSFIKRTISDTVQMGVQALESTQFKFVALMVAIVVQMQHSAHWYERIAPDGKGNMYAAYAYAFMVDLFILVVTMEGRINIAKTFAVLTFLANILYFQFWIGFDGSAGAYTNNAISSILVSGTIAYVIYGYTELFVGYGRAE
ncbi:MAG: hypothetical protein AAFZ15_13760 [Bacteroidota bacterium]